MWTVIFLDVTKTWVKTVIFLICWSSDSDANLYQTSSTHFFAYCANWNKDPVQCEMHKSHVHLLNIINSNVADKKEVNKKKHDLQPVCSFLFYFTHWVASTLHTRTHNCNEKEPHQVTLLHCTFTCKKKKNVCTDLQDNPSNSCWHLLVWTGVTRLTHNHCP